MGLSLIVLTMSAELVSGMDHKDLLDKLIQIQQAIGVETNFTVQKMLMEAQDCLLELEKERVENLRRNARQSDPVKSILQGFQAEPNSFTLGRGPRSAIRPTVNPHFPKSA